ncbi:toxin-antitoxin system, toxin component, Txe/YoeB family [Leuconostocaceae bacterium R-53105]|uniref:Endoribonuclease YoeB n=2 Tax=Convivina intestini TaxID=1505726 RepID=A0A2U1DF04_9LACO|nr:Txe/YoeB family addiction module toxin [Convivina intestini]PVY86244.1 Txe/YoeB family toxin of toxin-antitoxin system [Convivina intestini]CAH1851249.1 hypothetical protein R077811_00254 [Convivina intestini]SDB81814.1 toxin-antitoxin system, toxin component, Txe/YoeB family [Leuconostocaceae bacterium R-53105]
MSSNWQVEIKSSAKTDLKKILKSPLCQSFMEIKQVLVDNPYQPSHSFEKLTPPVAGFYSRRINSQHRVVYTVNKAAKTVTIYSCRFTTVTVQSNRKITN